MLQNRSIVSHVENVITNKPRKIYKIYQGEYFWARSYIRALSISSKSWQQFDAKCELWDYSLLFVLLPKTKTLIFSLLPWPRRLTGLVSHIWKMKTLPYNFTLNWLLGSMLAIGRRIPRINDGNWVVSCAETVLAQPLKPTVAQNAV